MGDSVSEIFIREPTFFILLSISPGPIHGYAIIKETERLSNGRIKLSTGTLYGAIKRLLDLGWIQRVDDPLPNDTERIRKSYELSDLGGQILGAEIDRLEKLVRTAKTQTAAETL